MVNRPRETTAHADDGLIGAMSFERERISGLSTTLSAVIGGLGVPDAVSLWSADGPTVQLVGKGPKGGELTMERPPKTPDSWQPALDALLAPSRSATG